jgi:AmmeMemoRadiSam system protein B
MMIREPAAAGLFYPAEPKRCRAELEACLPSLSGPEHLPAQIVGGVVPHAGWTYSGAVAARTFAAIAGQRRPGTIVVFGATHRSMKCDAAVFGRGAWQTPLGTIEIDERLAARLSADCPLIADDPYAHEEEHSIEVQVPFIQHFFPRSRLVPVLVMPRSAAVEIGRAAARVMRDSQADAVFIGSTDLTHYGPGYGMTSHGAGAEGLRWARDENDRRMIDLLLSMKAESVVAEARSHQNACGGGAIAACVAACREAGAIEGCLLQHTTSAEVAAATGLGRSSDAVGYASVVFGRLTAEASAGRGA